MAENPQGFAAYPPRVEKSVIMGYVTETNGIFHSRDIGRSFGFAGKIYLQFGDTFCHNSDGEFVGIANNTVAVIEEDKTLPFKSRYIEVEDNGFIKPFIQLTDGEAQYERDSNHHHRVVLWSFGGVVQAGDGGGRVWYQKNILNGLGQLLYMGTGIAKITAPSDGSPQQQQKQPLAQRVPNLLGDLIVFGPDEPRMGTFTAIAEGDWLYLFGDRPGDGKIILARVYNAPIVYVQSYEGRLTDPACYYYWDGAYWTWDWRRAAVIFEGMQQGAIVRSKLFGSARPFLFVGTSKWADSIVYLGASATLEGPWEVWPVCYANGIGQRLCMGRFMYCIYPHLWASDEERAELVVTWSEQYPGGVVTARIKLAPIEGGGVGVVGR